MGLEESAGRERYSLRGGYWLARRRRRRVREIPSAIYKTPHPAAAATAAATTAAAVAIAAVTATAFCR